MTNLTSSTPSLHADIRSPSLPSKRDKDHTHKWSYGSRAEKSDWIVETEPAFSLDYQSGIDKLLSARGGKVRPMVMRRTEWTDGGRGFYAAPPGPTPNISPHKSFQAGQKRGLTLARMHRKQDAYAEISAVSNDSSPSLSHSLADLLPPKIPSLHSSSAPVIVVPGRVRGMSRSDGGDSGVLFSFDNVKSPAAKVGLDALVDEAEREWERRETERVVSGFEVLDEFGDAVAVEKSEKAGKRRGKKSPKVLGLRDEVAGEEDEEWERI